MKDQVILQPEAKGKGKSVIPAPSLSCWHFVYYWFFHINFGFLQYDIKIFSLITECVGSLLILCLSQVHPSAHLGPSPEWSNAWKVLSRVPSIVNARWELLLFMTMYCSMDKDRWRNTIYISEAIKVHDYLASNTCFIYQTVKGLGSQVCVITLKSRKSVYRLSP